MAYGNPKAHDGKHTLHSGLMNRSPKSSDLSTRLPTSKTVDEFKERKSTAATPKTLGPRTA